MLISPKIGLMVALRKESVDRNEYAQPAEQAEGVALRKESVDRNAHDAQTIKSGVVALRKESVDRNMREDVSYSIIIKSLSARRAWIEI